MAGVFDTESDEFRVLVNAEGQYSLWPVWREAPQGWSVTGPRGPRQTCLDWIDSHWVDMRPKSLAAR